jgi:hypothetical protein
LNSAAFSNVSPRINTVNGTVTYYISDGANELAELGRPKKSLGGLTPAQYAKQLAIKVVTMPEDSKALRY